MRVSIVSLPNETDSFTAAVMSRNTTIQNISEQQTVQEADYV